MFKLLCPLPKDLVVCCSGGIDSISVAHWLFNRVIKPTNEKHNITLYYFNHNTPQANEMESAVSRFAKDFKIDIVIHV